MLGLDALLTSPPDWLTAGKIGLLAHPASIDSRGRHAADLLADCPGVNLVRLFGPEHGFFGRADAGEKVGDSQHPTLGLPVYSLYGEHRKPPAEWLADLDVLVFDLQDLGVRCYTFLSTLYLVMQTAEETGTTLAVLERPITAPGMTDGPLPDEELKSFVAQVDVPLCHGMTPGQAAQWMKDTYGFQVELRVVDMAPELHQPGQARETPWIPPSPAIKSWETARLYPCTVFCEAFPSVSVDRYGEEPFRYWAMEDLHAQTVSEDLTARNLPGVAWESTESNGRPAVHITCTDVDHFRPVTASLHLFDAIAKTHGIDWLWEREDNRPWFYDKLMGTSAVRERLLNGMSPAQIATECFQAFPST